MEKNEILFYLSKNIDVFDNVTLNDFYLLMNMDTSEFGLMNDKNYKITSLLNQIAKYAMIPSVIEVDQLEEIKAILITNDRELEFINIVKIIECCCDYIKLLQEEGTYHPSIQNIICLENGKYLYEKIQTDICSVISETTDEFQDNLITYANMVDERLLDVIDDKYEYMLEELENVRLDKKKILNILVKYSENAIMLYNYISVTLNDSNITYIDNSYIQYIKNYVKSSNNKISIGNSLIALSEMLASMDQYLQYTSDYEIIDLINDIKEEFILYYSYRYQYVKGKYQEDKMLEKCKKMSNN